VCCLQPPWTCSNHLLASQVDHSLIRKLKLYTEPTFLLIDELGYLSLDSRPPICSIRSFPLVTATQKYADHDQHSLFRLGNILHNTTIATAIADRLVENSEIILLGGESLAKPIRPDADSLADRTSGSDKAPLCDDIPRGGVRRVTPQRRCRRERELIAPALWSGSLVLLLPCSTSAPTICSCSRGQNTEPVSCSSCRRLYPPGLPPVRLHQIPTDHARPLLLRVGKVNSADKLYLVIESVKMDTKHCRCSTTPAPADGAEGHS